MIEAKVEQDLKAALLGGNKAKAEVLRGLRSVFLNEKIAKGQREVGLDDDVALMLISKEVKKRTESAEMYDGAGATDRAEAERSEGAILGDYLPSQLSDDELADVVDGVVTELGDDAQMGRVIGAVRQKVGASAGGGRIAAAVKAKLGT